MAQPGGLTSGFALHLVFAAFVLLMGVPDVFGGRAHGLPLPSISLLLCGFHNNNNNNNNNVGRRLTSLSGDARQTSFLFQRLSMLIQRFNSALFMDSFCFSDEDPDL